MSPSDWRLTIASWFKKHFEQGNVESKHRLAWRCYSFILIVILSTVFVTTGERAVAAADETTSALSSELAKGEEALKVAKKQREDLVASLGNNPKNASDILIEIQKMDESIKTLDASLKLGRTAKEIKAAVVAKPLVAQDTKKTESKPVENLPQEDPSVIRTMEKINGEISSLSPSSIGVLYETKGTEEFEILLNLDKKTKLEGYKKKSDIKLGDTVEMQYEKALEFQGKPNERTTMALKTVHFLKRPSQNPLLAQEKQV